MLAREMENNWVCTSAVSLDAIMKRGTCVNMLGRKKYLSVFHYMLC